jgi:hypothetical protein
MVLATKYIALSQFNFKIQDNKNILILGDSHTQCAINDSVFKNAINLSESADSYFYSYVKLKRILANNSQIDTLVLGYSTHNISKNQDAWFKDSQINGFKLPIYFYLFDNEDMIEFIKINPLQVPKNAMIIVKRNFSHMYREYHKESINKFGIGGFLPLTEKHNNPSLSANKNIKNRRKEFSAIDIEFLKKIYALCKKNKIKVILLNTPTIETKKSSKAFYQKKYFSFAKEELSNATLMDFSELSVTKDKFADNSHLNSKGAILFSKFLMQAFKK